MRVSPTPDVVARFIMLFRGVRAENVGRWAPAAAEDSVTFWSNVVRVDAMRPSDRASSLLDLDGIELRESGGLAFFFFPSVLCVGDGSLVKALGKSCIYSKCFHGQLRASSGPQMKLLLSFGASTTMTCMYFTTDLKLLSKALANRPPCRSCQAS
jgi:hypothetical protein